MSNVFTRGRKSDPKPTEDVAANPIVNAAVPMEPAFSAPPPSPASVPDALTESGSGHSTALFDIAIDEFVVPPGWSRMQEAPQDGTRIMVSETGKDKGVLVYWRISRMVDKAKLRFIPKGRWTDFTTHTDINFIPQCWKHYNAEEYWPLQGKK